MQRNWMTAAAAVLAFACAGLAADSTIEMRKAQVRFASEDGATNARVVTLSGRFHPADAPPFVEFRRDGLSISLGGVELLQVDPTDDRLSWRRKGTRVFYRGRQDGGGARYLLVDLLRGYFRFRASDIDLPDLQSAGAWEVPVALTIGDATLTGELDFLATQNRRGAARWRLARGPQVGRPLPLGDFGESTGLTDRRMVVLRTRQEWEALWSEHAGGAAPEVDFTKHMIVALFAGLKSSLAHTIRLDSVEQSRSEVVVRFTETAPGPNCIVATAVGYPFTITRVPRLDGTDVFEGRERVLDCRR